MELLLPSSMISMFTLLIKMSGVELQVQTVLFRAVGMLGAGVAILEASISLEVRPSVSE